MKTSFKKPGLWGVARRLGGLGALLALIPLLAIQMRPVAIEDLAARAERVVHAKVDAVEVSATDGGSPVTHVELLVTETWKGSHEPRLKLVQPGGTLGRRRVVVPGDATYQPGQEAVVFLVSNPRGEWLTLELGQGKFDVLRTGKGAYVRNPFHGGAPEPGGFRPPNKSPIDLQTLRQRVKEAVQ